MLASCKLPGPHYPTDAGMPPDSSRTGPEDVTKSPAPRHFLTDATGPACDAALCASATQRIQNTLITDIYIQFQLNYQAYYHQIIHKTEQMSNSIHTAHKHNRYVHLVLMN